MCRWLAYSGSPILMKEALYGRTHSQVDQILRPRLGAETTNGDGFGSRDVQR
jgi:predicted glutamine amidotransferase